MGKFKDHSPKFLMLLGVLSNFSFQNLLPLILKSVMKENSLRDVSLNIWCPSKGSVIQAIGAAEFEDA